MKEKLVAYIKRIKELEQHIQEQARVLEEWHKLANEKVL